ncbi:MAG: hypothetical protein Kapaf2KO_04960 [Candidatus Kapaibacteriales bacterium]
MNLNYKEEQKKRIVKLIQSKNPVFYGGVGGKFYRKDYRDFILTDFNKNLYKGINDEAIEYFLKNKISWWGGKNPTGHVLSSQIACVNHLYAIRYDKNSVLGLLKTLSGDFIDVLEIQTDNHLSAFIQFESVSDNDYLNEGKSTRGSNCTSIDALIYAKHKDGTKWLIPIEWKYTEFYGNSDKAKEGFKANPKKYKGKVRQERYTDLINKSNQLISEDHFCYYFEPFYQLMRQTLWAEQMIANNDKETIIADNYLHVHVIPSSNSDLLDKKYKCSGEDMKSTWLNHLIDKDKYIIISPKDFLSNLDPIKYKDLISYLNVRYWK